MTDQLLIRLARARADSRKLVKSKVFARTLEERFWAKVDTSGGPDACWPWTASFSSAGYGRFAITSSHLVQAHRLAWELTTGVQIPSGLFACHRCDNRKCVNPSHIFLGTHRDNMADMHRKGRHSMHKAVLAPIDVQLIRALKRDKKMKAKEIAELFPEVSYSNVCLILKGRTWGKVA